ncbi:MAG: hypothetical protein KDD35_09615, partial [Bdellovibrionales bacterium]|nr:hypothetical protein [Bdellovibrionales bacterium]
RVCSQSCQTTIRLMMPPERHLWNRSFQFGEKLKDLQGLGSLTTIEYVPIVEEFSRLHPQPVKYEEDQKEQFQHAFFYAGPKKVLRTRPPVEDVDAGFLGPPVQISEFDVNSLLSEVKNNFIGWKCDIGLEQIFVDSHGTVLRAGCRVGGKIGHISDAIIKFPLKAVRCTKTYCHCGTDIVVTKVSPEWELAQNLNRERKIPLVGVNTLKSYGVYFCALVFPYITKFVKYRLIPGSINLIKRILGPRLTHFLRYGIWPWLCDLPLIRFLRFGLRPWIADFPVRRVFRVFVPPWKIHLMELLKKESKQKPSA